MDSFNRLITKVNRKVRTDKKNEYIVIHYVGAVSSAYNNAKYFEKEYRGASAHYFVDENSIWQVVEDKDDAWHVGTNKGYKNGARNWNSIGIEMCCKKDEKGNFYFEEQTVKNTIELTRYLAKKYGIDTKYHIARHFDCTGKLCPKPWIDDETQWIKFLKEVQKEDNMLDGKVVTMITNLCNKYGEENIEKAISRLVETYIDDGQPAPWAVKEIEEAKALELTDGSRPEMFTTRQEAMIMCLRTYKKIKEEEK